MTPTERHRQLIDEIRRVSEENGIPVSGLYRDDFRKLSPIGRTKYVQMSGAWTRAKREVLGQEIDHALESAPVDPLPPDMELVRISTTTGPEGEIRGQSTTVRPPRPEPREIPEGMALQRISTYTGADGSVGQWVIAQAQGRSKEQILEELLRDLPEKIPVREGCIPAPTVDVEDILAVYPLGDPHIGMLAWGRETLDDDYDLDIAGRLLRSAIDDLAMSTPRAKQALIVNLGDFFHSDSDEKRTLRSKNTLDVDSRWAKILRVGLDTMTHLIDRCLEAHELVRVINEIGNHDDQSAIMLGIALDRHYSQEPRVSIDLSPAHYHYHRFGRCLIGTTHYLRKSADLESIMAHDCAGDWSETEHRYWLVGHVHHAKKDETRNCLVESFRTLSPRDAWAAGAGYRAGRDMCRISLHREHGEISRSTVPVSALRRQI